MKAFVTYLKEKSAPMQLAHGSTGWLEMPCGRRWNPAHTFKFNAQTAPRPWWRRLMGLFRGRYGH